MLESTPLLPAKNAKNAAISNKKAARNERKSSKQKLDTFEGVFLPTTLNVLSILMFLRFGFIIGQMGIVGTLGLLVMSYAIDILTVLSVSAISTNGTVKGGGAYYMISRSLGPEFGGAIGIIFFIGQILNSSLNVVGFIEPLLVNFGKKDAEFLPLLPETYGWQLIYSTILLALCTGVAMVGSTLVSKTAFWLFLILTFSTLSIPVSAIFSKLGYPLPPPFDNLYYTGLAWSTLKANLWPHFTSDAAGSTQPHGVPETFRNMFGIFFPATAGIFAGASMSGELKTPSKSIPQGTLKGLLASFILYFLVIVSLGSSVPRELLHNDIKIIQTVNLQGIIIVMGEVATSLFSVIMGVVGAACMLNAIADDKIIPGLSIFSLAKKSPGAKRRAELYSILFTWLLAQVFLFADINQIATFITMAFLMTFLVTNLACFLLKVGSAPNFRPSFKYFNSKTAFTGGLVSVVAMYICDGVSATSVIIFLVFLIMMIHYTTPPLKFGDISQLLIYHQVRKYLLRLKLQMSVKYWRPQILLLCDDPRTSWNLIGFCNHLKKGGLYILGHVVLLSGESKEGSVEFNVDSYNEVKSQKKAWVKLRDMARIKAFVQIAIGPSLPWGVRNVYLGSGLGGMRPNITVIGFYDFHKHGVVLPTLKHLPTDDCRKERKVSINQWVQIVEDLVIMQATVAVAGNFRALELPVFAGLKWFNEKHGNSSQKSKYIDLYPIQMSTVCLLEDGKSVLSTNFDTYTLILQLGSILSTVDEWKKNGYTLRIIVFVETSGEVDDEKLRLENLLESLRIEAVVKIVCLDDGSINAYNFLVKGYKVTQTNQEDYKNCSTVLADDRWWNNLVETRQAVKEIEVQKQRKKNSQIKPISIADEVSSKLMSLAFTSKSPTDTLNMGKSLKNNRRYTLSNLHQQGLSLSLNMNTQGGDSFYKYEDTVGSSSDSDSEKESLVTNSGSERSSLNRVPGTVLPSQPVVTSQQHSRQPLNSRDFRPMNLSLPVNKTTVGRALNLGYKNKLASGSTDQLSIRSSRSNLRPNFLAVKIPNSKIRDDDEDDEEDSGDDDEDEDQARPTITFVADIEERVDVEEDIKDDNAFDSSALDDQKETKDEQTNLLKGSSRSDTPKVPLRSKQRDYFNTVPVRASGVATPSIITNDGITEHLQSPYFAEEDDGDTVDQASIVPDIMNSSKADIQNDKVTFKKIQLELQNLTFNDIPAKGQHLILNELMKKHSSKEETAVIFSTLPAPGIGTHLDDVESFEYTNSLAIWLDGLPPVMLLNSQTVTVTTSL